MRALHRGSVLSAAVVGVTVVGGLAGAKAYGVTAPAAPTPGNLLIMRVGDGVSTAAAAAVFVDEYTTAGLYVQSFAAPATGALALTGGLGTTTEGDINVSSDGNYLVFAGYRKDAGGTGGGGGDASAASPRVIGRMSLADGTIDTSTVIQTNAAGPADLFDLSSVRGVASTDGQHFWVTGTSKTAGSGGLVYTEGFGSSAVSTLLQDQNYRGVTIAGGDLYASRASTIHKVTGLPTATPITTTSVISSASSGQNYESITLLDLNPEVPGVDTAYVPNNTQGGIEKWYFDTAQTKWVKAGVIGVSAGASPLNVAAGTPTVDALGVISVPLYFTTTGNPVTTASVLEAVTDVGVFGAVPTGTPTLLKTADPNMAFKGIVQVPLQGDVTGDFKLNADDYVAIDRFVAKNGIGGLSASRQSGDLNNDGLVDAADYLLIDTAWAKAHGAPDPAVLASREAAFGADYVAALAGAVPEPGAVGVVMGAVAVVGEEEVASWVGDG